MTSTAHELYVERVMALADEEKLRLVELIAHELASRNGGQAARQPLDAAQRQSARERFRRHAGAVSRWRATGASNESIDADLAREYGAGPESIYGGQEARQPLDAARRQSARERFRRHAGAVSLGRATVRDDPLGA